MGFPASDGTSLRLNSRRFQKGWAVVMIPAQGNTGRDSMLHYSAAHTIYDGSVDLEAAAMLEMAGGRSAVIQATRRDAFKDRKYSLCQKDHYPTDGAHDNRTMFHAVQLAILKWQNGRGCPTESCAFVQFHGMKDDSCPGVDAFVSAFGNYKGAYNQRYDKIYADDTFFINKLTAAMEKLSPFNIQRPKDVYCHLTGGSNLFGRVVNGIPIGTECDHGVKSSIANGRFVHIEQNGIIGIRSQETKSFENWARAIEAAIGAGTRAG